MVQGTARRVEDLESVDDCTEEIIFRFMDAWADITASREELLRRRYDLPDKIREVLLRAREVPLREADLCSPPQIVPPAQPA